VNAGEHGSPAKGDGGLGKRPGAVKPKDGLALAVTLAIAAGALAWAWTKAVMQTVYLVNGFDVPVRVEVDGRALELGPSRHLAMTLARGVHRLRTTSAAGAVLDDVLVDVPPRSPLVVYNAAGAAPLYAESVVYGAQGGPAGPGFTFHGGQRLVVRPRADFVFAPPPESISVGSTSEAANHVRWRFDLVPGGWQTTFRQLTERGAYREALALALDAARTDPRSEAAAEAAASTLARLRGTGAAIDYLEGALERQPEDFTLHRTYQHFMGLAGRFDEARERYRAYRDRHPDSALAAVLLARVESRDAAVPLYRAALERRHGDMMARRGLARALLQTGHIPESVTRFAEMAASDPDYRYYAGDHVRALLLLRKNERALEAARRACDKFPAEWRLAVLYAQVASLPGVEGLEGRPAATYIDRLAVRNGDPAFGLWMRSLAGLPLDEKELKKLPEGPMRSAIAIQWAAGRDPAAAWLQCAKAPPGTFARLAAPVALLLATEFERAGDERIALALFGAAEEIPFPVSAFKDYVRDGREDADMWRLDLETRAVLDLVRARALQGQGAAAASLYAAARKRDPVPSLAARAEAAWPLARVTRPLVEPAVVVRKHKG
jgi:tetratricopeptide (TPR) repeat protein